jgi:ankyrin repeat protein
MTKEVSIIEAIKKGDLESLKKMVTERESVNLADENGWTALHWAAGKGDANAVSFLLEHGADVVSTGNDERTPLMIAKAADRREVVQILSNAEQASGQWKDLATTQLYCKAYEVGDLRRYSHWSENPGEKEAQAAPLSDHDIVYLHQNFTVTRSMWPDQEVVFTKVTSEWKGFCETNLQFSIPEGL